MTVAVTSPSEPTQPPDDPAPDRSVWRSIVRSAGTRVAMLAISAILGIVNTRLIIEHFGQSSYAQYGLLIGIGLLFPFADLGMSAALINAVGSSPDPRADRRVVQVLATALRVLCVSAVVLLLLSLTVTLAGGWSSILGSGLQTGSGAITAAACVALIAITLPAGFGDRILTGLGKNHVSIVVQGMQTPIVFICLMVIIHVSSGRGAYVAALPFLVTFVLALVSCRIAAHFVHPTVGKAVRAVPRLRSERGSGVFSVAWPMLVQMIALPIAMQTDRLILSHVSDAAQLARYNLASQIFTPVWSVVNAAGVVLWPIFARERAEGRKGRLSPVPISLGFGAAAAVVCVVLSLASPLLTRFASGGTIHLPVGLLAAFCVLMIFQATKYPLGMFMTDARGLRYQALMIVIFLPVNLGLSLYFARIYGAAGPVLGSAIGVLVCQLLANLRYVRRELRRAPGRAAAEVGTQAAGVAVAAQAGAAVAAQADAAVAAEAVAAQAAVAEPPAGRRTASGRFGWTGWQWSRRRVTVSAFGGLGFLVLLGLGWLILTGALAARQLQRVDDDAASLRAAIIAGDYVKAQALLRDIGAHAHRAHQLTTGPAWALAAKVPVLGTPADTARVIAAEADHTGADVLPGVLRLARTLIDAPRQGGGGINLATLIAAQPQLGSSAQAAGLAADAIARTSPTWVGPIQHARGALLSDLRTLHNSLAGADHALRTAVPMLGATTPQRYFVAFENEAEARGIGGLPGAFAIITADKGVLRFSHFGSDRELSRAHASIDLGPQYNRQFGNFDPTNTYQFSDVSPHFPDAARIWAAMWFAKTGQRITGAMAIDPTALGYLLDSTGPVRLPGGGTATGRNVVSLTESKQYAAFSDQSARKSYLVDIARAISRRLVGGHLNGAGVVRALSHGAKDHRFLVWSADPKVQSDIVSAGYGGVLPSSAAPASGFVVVNVAGTKLDYYLDRTMTYERNSCAAGGVSDGTIRLDNTAPKRGLPPYVTTRSDSPRASARPGDNRLQVTYYVSRGAKIISVLLDGEPVKARVSTLNGLVTVTLRVELPAGRARTVSVTASEPAATKPTTLLRQPLARPLRVVTRGARCRG
ncbi:DUF4012 domain-containing protein [uncultured Jatrophihabitans sp.]|uniref:DUF4012 domain-containing protein n=1 Tax=uncultured Jatrophihabitans sp. TaxID=1610747 RepID=UPI0035C9C0E4